MDELKTLERIAESVRRAHADVAPSYVEYYTLALGIASTCGESGRPYFHEFCSYSPKYRQAEAEKFYTYCLRKADGRITLGSVVYLARRAGCELDPLLATDTHPSFPSFPSSFTSSSHTHARTNKVEAVNQPPQEGLEEGVEDDENPLISSLPTFPSYTYPPFLEQMLQCAPSLPQRDAMLLSITTALGVSLNWLTFTYYGNRKAYPNLLNMTLGSPASGKGSVAWIKQLVMPLHEACLKQSEEEMKQYLRDKNAWDCLGNQKKKHDMPQMPSQRLFIIPGNNSATGIKENLISAQGVGLVFETEIDTMASAISADYGHFGDTLRKGYDNDEISFYRRTEREYKHVRRSCFGICLTGTLSQLFGIIPTAEDGLQSRFLFYVLPEISAWVNQFEHEKHDYYQRFYQWGVQWKSVLDAVRQVATSFELELTPDQVTRFNDHFSQVFGRACVVHGGPMKSAVARLGLNLCRMMSVLATVRALEGLLPVGNQPLSDVLPTQPKKVQQKLLASPYLTPAAQTPHENLQDGTFSVYTLRISDADFEALLQLVEPLYLHSSFVFSLLPKPKRPRTTCHQRQVFDLLPLTFTREQALEAAQTLRINEKTIDSLLMRNVQKGTLERLERGVYTFAKKIRNTPKS